MPTALSTPVVPPARRWARKPRSEPLQRSSASPSAATPATPSRTRAGARRPPECNQGADERKAQAAVIERRRSAGERGVEQLAAAVEEAPGVAAGCAMTQRQLALPDAEPRADRIDRHPHLAAEPRREREAGSRARLRRARAGPKAVRWRKPLRARMSARAARFARPKPPPCRSANAATVRSASRRRAARGRRRDRHRRAAASRVAPLARRA